MLRRFLIPATLLILTASSAAAQRVEITPFYGFQFAGEFEDRFDEGDFDGVDVDEGETYGLFLNFALDPGGPEGGQIELMYNRQETELQANRLFGPDVADLDIEYWHLGFLYQWAPGQARPYVVIGLGATRLESPGFESETRFSWSGGGGVKLMFNQNFGVRFDGRIYSTIIDEDDDVFCDPRGCFSYDDDTFLVQLDVKGGLVLAF
ncbi:MAG: porin family protein [bacterium]|nr:porin family protein [bacterium]